jgi:hypothetical protein
MQFLHLSFSTFAVEKMILLLMLLFEAICRASQSRKTEMRIVETVLAGFVALAAQVLVVGAVLI